MARFGTIADAKRAVEGRLEEIGEGVTRTAYIDKRGKYVYKVAHKTNGGRDGNNIGEHLLFEVLRSIYPIKGKRNFPPTRLIEVLDRVVLVMPYFDDEVGADDIEYRRYADLRDWLTDRKIIGDVALFNCKAEDGWPVVIDGGELGYNEADVDKIIEIAETGRSRRW